MKVTELSGGGHSVACGVLGPEGGICRAVGARRRRGTDAPAGGRGGAQCRVEELQGGAVPTCRAVRGRDRDGIWHRRSFLLRRVSQLE